MPDFRCMMLDERGAILFPSDITAENLRRRDPARL